MEKEDRIIDEQMRIDNAVHEAIMKAFGYPKPEITNPQTLKALGEDV